VVGGSFDGQYHPLGATREFDKLLGDRVPPGSQADPVHIQWRSYYWDPSHVVEVREWLCMYRVPFVYKSVQRLY
jgi:hypothetical protein